MIKRITRSPVRIGLFVFILSFFVVVLLSFPHYAKSEFWENVLVEAHGMLLDVLVLGVFVAWLHSLREKALENRIYRNEIDDFRKWKSDEATFRIAGNVRRLSRNGITEIDLSNCHLKGVSFSKLDLSGSSMYGCDLGNGNLKGANLSNVKLRGAYLGDTNFKGANLSHASLEAVRSPRAIYRGVDFDGTNLTRAQLWDSDLSGAQFRNADFTGASLGGVNLHFANLRYAKNLSIEQVLEASCLNKTMFPEGWEEEIKMRNPHLLSNQSKRDYMNQLANREMPNNKIQPTQ
jgi:uncharacterized protein YjbI with pentapeptide repeats